MELLDNTNILKMVNNNDTGDLRRRVVKGITPILRPAINMLYRKSSIVEESMDQLPANKVAEMMETGKQPPYLQQKAIDETYLGI